MATAQSEIFVQPKVRKWTPEEYHAMDNLGVFFDKQVELSNGEVLDTYQAPSAPRLHLWTSEEYYKLAELGLFEGRRVELIGGRIIEMSAMSRPHVNAVKRSTRAFEKAFGQGWFVQNQSPLDLDDIDGSHQPEPDVAVIEGDEDDYVDEHPTTAALILEVSLTTFKYDKDKKASLYAKSRIADYWVLNLNDQQLHVFRKPMPDASAPFWYSYSEETIFGKKDSVSPLAKPDAVITVASLLPPKIRKDR